MKISKEAKRLARELFHASLTNGRLDAAKTSNLADRLVKAKPRGYAGVLREFTRMVRLELASRHAVVESATVLDAAETAQLKKEIPARFGDDLTLEFRTNPSLLGGARISVGNDVWDGSVKARLAAFSQQL